MARLDIMTTVGMLRDHFAAHDRPLAFLFGAGTSSCIDTHRPEEENPAFSPLIPNIEGLTSMCGQVVRALGTEFEGGWDSLEAECAERDHAVNIETILSRVRSKVDALHGTDTLGGLDAAGWQKVDESVRHTIANKVQPPDVSVPNALPHQDFASWAKNTTRRQPIEVFTTNYDTLFETTFDKMRVPHFDGFVGSQRPFFSPECVEDDRQLPSPAWVRLWKLHGSVTWSLDDVDGTLRVSRGGPNPTGEMILPSHRKYDQSRKQPYRSLMDRLTRSLAHKDALLVTSGFSFGDQHINAIVLDALEQNPNTHLIALSYLPISEDDEVARWAEALPNVLYLGPNAVVHRGEFGPWFHRGKADASLESTSYGLATADQNADGGVVFRGGDFHRLAGFLRQISGTVAP